MAENDHVGHFNSGWSSSRRLRTRLQLPAKLFPATPHEGLLRALIVGMFLSRQVSKRESVRELFWTQSQAVRVNVMLGVSQTKQTVTSKCQLSRRIPPACPTLRNLSCSAIFSCRSRALVGEFEVLFNLLIMLPQLKTGTGSTARDDLQNPCGNCVFDRLAYCALRTPSDGISELQSRLARHTGLYQSVSCE
jgi:hypothetical protein